MNLETIRPLCDYHYWANEKLLGVCDRLTAEQFTRDLHGSFSSIQAIWAHMLTVDAAWLERFVDEKQPRTAPQEIPDAAAARERWLSLLPKYRLLVDRTTESDLNRIISFRAKDGMDYSFTLGVCLTHLFNHGTYHRGQIADRLRQVGEVPEATNLTGYMWTLRD